MKKNLGYYRVIVRSTDQDEHDARLARERELLELKGHKIGVDFRIIKDSSVGGLSNVAVSRIEDI